MEYPYEKRLNQDATEIILRQYISVKESLYFDATNIKCFTVK